MIGWQRHVRGVIDLPDLEGAPQFFVGQKFIGHVDPSLGAARQSMQHHDDAPLWIEWLHQIQARLIDSTVTPKQTQQRLPIELRACQPQTIASCEIASQRNALPMERQIVLDQRVIHRNDEFVRGQQLLHRAHVEAEHYRHVGGGHFVPGGGFLRKIISGG